MDRSRYCYFVKVMNVIEYFFYFEYDFPKKILKKTAVIAFFITMFQC